MKKKRKDREEVDYISRYCISREGRKRVIRNLKSGKEKNQNKEREKLHI